MFPIFVDARFLWVSHNRCYRKLVGIFTLPAWGHRHAHHR